METGKVELENHATGVARWRGFGLGSNGIKSAPAILVLGFRKSLKVQARIRFV
jgi:hypothetical protein